MPHSTPHHSTPENGRHNSRVPSRFRNLSRRASQFLKRDRSKDRQETAVLDSKESRKHISFDEGCLPPLPLIRKCSKKSQVPAHFSIAPDSPLHNAVPKLPEIKDLGKGRVVRKARSLAIIPSRSQYAAQDLAEQARDAFTSHMSLDLGRGSIKMPGAFPSSSPTADTAPSIYAKLNQSTDTVIRVKPGSLTLSSGYSKLNESTDTVIRHRPESEQSPSGLLQNVSGMPRSETEGSVWTSTTEPDTEPGTPLARQRTHQDKGKGKGKAEVSEAPYRANQQFGIASSASTTSSFHDLPAHKFLRHQPKLPSQRRWVSIDTESHTTQKEQAEQAAPRRKLYLPSSTSRSKLQWGDLSSNVSSLNSADARNMRKDLRLPSRRVSTPNPSGLRRAEEYVEGLSEQPEQGQYDPCFESSRIRNEVFSNKNDQSYQDDSQANDAFFQANQHTDQYMPHKAIINNLYEAVKRVDVEMARVQLENHQLLQSEEQANARAAFWEERAGGLEEIMKDRQREKEELLDLLIERGIEVPERLLRRWEETQLEDVPEEAEEDAGYEGDVSGTTQESYEETLTMQQGDVVVEDKTT